MEIKTVEMHTGGEPLRIVQSGLPPIMGKTILEKRRYCQEKLDFIRKLLIYEPRGHFDMYGAYIVEPDHPEADMAVLFLHNEGYSTMCGHAVIALGRYAVDYKLVSPVSPVTCVNIQCPCGLVRAFVDFDGQKSGSVRFRSVPAFAFDVAVTIETERYGNVVVDVGYGGAFYALVPAERFGLDVRKSRARDLVEAASHVTACAKKQVKLRHPDSEDLAFLYGTILTDGKDEFQDDPTANICIYAEDAVDRSPTGSGVTTRIAVQYHRKLIGLNQVRTFESVTGSLFTGMVAEETTCGEFKGVIVEVAGKGYYTGTATFTAEPDDKLGQGFLLH